MIKEFLRFLIGNEKKNTIPPFEVSIHLPENWHFVTTDVNGSFADVEVFYKNTFVFGATYNSKTKNITDNKSHGYYESQQLYNKIQCVIAYNTKMHRQDKLNDELKILKIITE